LSDSSNTYEGVITPPIPSYRWRNIAFFAGTHLTAIIGVPLYLRSYTVPLDIFLLSAFYFIATGMAVTVGYHRLFSHRTFSANKFVEFLALFFGAASFEESALCWSSQHRAHHQYTDTDLDPYNIKRGFFYAHMGWMMFWKFPKEYPNVKDLKQNRMLMHQDKHFIPWSIGAGIVLPALIGALLGHFWEAGLFAVAARITLVYQGTFCINSFCHMFGRATYDINSTAKDNWVNALFTWGEGYHNFHHRFPNDYRNGIRWFHWDPSKWAIRFFEMIGFAYNLKRTSPFTIINARLAAENSRAVLHLAKIEKRKEQVAHIREAVNKKYEQVTSLLQEWEIQLKNHRALLQDNFQRSSDRFKDSLDDLKDARARFFAARREWLKLVDRHIYVRSPLTVSI